MARHRAFTMTELVVIFLIALVLIGMLLPAFSGRRTPAPQMQNNTHLRGIHQSIVMYAQGNGGHFPGLNSDGTDANLSVENRFQILLDGNYFTGDYAISPVEAKVVWTTGPVTSANYSYAMLQIPNQGGRRAEWHETLNTDAVAMSDRNVGSQASPLSVHARSANVQRPRRPWRAILTSPRRPLHTGTDWHGSVIYNDNHAVFESTHLLDTSYAGVATPRDHLFDAPTDDDALLIHTGN